ncbi:Ribosomal protein L18 [Elusimicrobium minutum Pei191]|uniref:Large ribosomal subunit protein uL18 n=1 Tax=Elusimicrobium minutum (strain Pei191) TaxID=445932 RepID=B2KEK5_ELUMP|nr:50S ribosomal protein L18 [Elusimicrobium minutum]ACC98951.1 Ribosomal protein L18 [Elusimicrobium minutum Pei191]
MATKQERYQYRKERTRKNLMEGGARRPRLSVYRSLKYLYAQVIDDNEGKTIVSATTLSKELEGKFKSSAKSIEAAKALGEIIAKKALDKGVTEVMFDRGGRIYHGRIKALADAAREAGLKF